MIRSSRRSRTAPHAASGSTAETKEKPHDRTFAVSAHKTIAAAAADVLAAWTNPRRRSHWLAGVKISVRRGATLQRIRLTCEDDESDIEVRITPLGSRRSAVAVNHTRLADLQVAAERRHCWKEMLAGLQHYLEDQA